MPDNRAHQRHPFPRWIAVAAAGPGLLALAIALGLHQTTGLAWSACFVHGVVGAAGGILAASAGLLFGGILSGSLSGSLSGLLRSRESNGSHRRDPVRWPYLVAGTPFFLVLVAAGLGAWVSRRNWGMDLSGTILLGFLPHAAELVVLLGWRVWVLLALWIVLSAAPAWHWAGALADREVSLPAALRLRATGAMTIVALAITVATATLVARDAAIVHGDPLLNLLRTGDEPALPPTAPRLAAWVQDEEQRRTFDGGTPTRKHVILILSDGVRPDHLPFHGYARETMPFLHRLSREPGWAQVGRAYSAATESLGGIGSIVSGRSTRTMSARSYGIVEFLARHGFRTHLLLNGEHAWYELRAMYGSRLTTFHDIRDKSPDIPLHDDAQVVAWTGELPDADDTPAFLMFFLMGTHQLSPLDPKDAHYTREEGTVPPFWFTAPQGEAQTRAAIDRYDDQLRAADGRLEEIWKILGRKGYLKDCVVLFSSDHGQTLGEHGDWGHGAYLWEPTIRIPLALWSDGALPPVDTTRIAWTPDIAPTLAEAAGLVPLPTWEGLSLFSTAARDTLFVDSVQATTHVRAVLLEEDGKHWKLQQGVAPDGQVASERLFELRSDPNESTDLMATAATALLARLRALADGSVLPAAPPAESPAAPAAS